MMREKLRVGFQVACLVAVIAIMMSFAPVSVSAGEDGILPSTDYCTYVCRRWGDVACEDYEPDRYYICR